MLRKKSQPIKKTRPSVQTTQTRVSELPISQIPAVKTDQSTSKCISKETDAYNDLSISYIADFPEPLSSDAILTNARSSLIDLRTEAQLYLSTSRRAATKLTHTSSITSQHRHSLSTPDHLTSLLQDMHFTMKQLSEKLELVNEKSFIREEECKELKISVIELKEKLQELKVEKINRNACSKMCEIS